MGVSAINVCQNWAFGPRNEQAEALKSLYIPIHTGTKPAFIDIDESS